MASVFPGLDPDSHIPHALHAQERMWPETNCYTDLWIEVLNAMGLPPEAMLGFTLRQAIRIREGEQQDLDVGIEHARAALRVDHELADRG